MIEIIFVIVILGILAVMAVPKFMTTRDDAEMVGLAQNIAAATSDVASYMVANGEASADLSEMSNALHSLVERGIGTRDTLHRSIAIHVGDETECVKLEIVSSGTDENLTLIDKRTSDPKCRALQKMIPENVYPIALKGTRIITQ